MNSNDYNPARPMIMHIDLNSCFATVEQQARPLLRGRPVAIVNRRTENTSIITASYEAKAHGVKVGMRFREAQRLVPDLILVETDPAKYRFVYHKLLAIMQRYSSHVTMKSIDEGVIDFTQTTAAIAGRNLVDIGHEMKQNLRDEIGIAMRCNVGIGTNRFMAKMAAGLHKPDGLDVIDADNLRAVMSKLSLTDLTGIASQNQRRLNAVGIETPLQFLDTDSETLHKIVFKSIVGQQWHRRLRGWEVDDVQHDLKTVGRQYVMEAYGLPRDKVVQRLHHLCESVGAKLRSQKKVARGVYVYAKTYDHQHWHGRQMAVLPFFSDGAIYAQALKLFNGAPLTVREIGISCYELSDGNYDQLSIFGDELARQEAVTGAIDAINGQFGERTIHSASTLGTDEYVKQKIPFGSTRYL